MSRAEYLLTHSDMSIHQIATELGYQKSGSFAKTFKKQLGMLPTEYRTIAGSS